MSVSNQKMIEEGINFLRALSNAERSGAPLTIQDLAEEHGFPVKHVKDAITAARQHKEKSVKPFTVALKQPIVKIHRDTFTGRRQIIEGVEVELLKEITIRYDNEETTEFTTLLPVKIRIKRVWTA